MKVSTVSEMRAMDSAAIEKFGIPEALLMENAGLAVTSVLSKEMGIGGKRFLVFCGGGNNGGDGFVVARKIHSNGGAVRVFVLGDMGRLKGVAKMNLDILRHMPVEIQRLQSVSSLRLDAGAMHCDGIVDAILGTGLTGDVRGVYREVIDWINASGKWVCSVDIPSGVHGDTGLIMGTAVRADVTVTFGLPKVGNMLFPGHGLCGKLYVSHISFPPSMCQSDSLKVGINGQIALPLRDKNGHKGDFGDALFIAGAAGYYGAPYFAALSFLKAGGGYSRLAAPRSVVPFVATRGSEIVFVPQMETDSGSISLENRHALLELAEKVDIVVLGPGLSLARETQQLARELTREITKPLLIDGDGITSVCCDLQTIRDRKAETILTPHLGEMSRITGLSVREVNSNKIDILQGVARDLNATIVLKGAHSLVGTPGGWVHINTSGNSGMATAGSGDVLAGTIVAMFGLGLPIEEAVRKGVFIHGLAGDLAAEEKGEDGITAQDIMDFLPLAVRIDREESTDAVGTSYVGARLVA